MTIERQLARSGFTLTRDHPAPPARVWDAFAVEDQKLGWRGAGIHMSTSVASLKFEPNDEGTRFMHVEHGVFFDQFLADGSGREKGTRGLLDALGRYLG